MTVQDPAPPLTIEVDPQFARPAAAGTLSPIGVNLDAAHRAVANAKAVAETWLDQFWEASGYDKATVMAALTELEKLSAIYAGTSGLSGMHDFQADAQVLTVQEAPDAPTA